MEYYNTYWMAHALESMVVHEDEDYILQGFFDDELHLYVHGAFPKFSALHLLIDHLLTKIIYESIDDISVDGLINIAGYELWANSALKYYDIPHPSFDNWLAKTSMPLSDILEKDIREYLKFLQDSGPLQNLIDQMVEEVFFLMFLNRGFLRILNQKISSLILQTKVKDLAKEEQIFFKSDGFLKRRPIPVWARKAVLYRDRGQCSICHRDVSGLVSIHNEKHFDHIVPLAKGGINDVTNLQLLCEPCNLKKKHYNSDTSKYYEKWYK